MKFKFTTIFPYDSWNFAIYLTIWNTDTQYTEVILLHDTALVVYMKCLATNVDNKIKITSNGDVGTVERVFEFESDSLTMVIIVKGTV